MIDPSFLSMSLPCLKHFHQNRSNSRGELDKENKMSKSSKQLQCVFNQGKSTKPSTESLQKLVHHGILNRGKNVIRYILASYRQDSHEPQSSTMSLEYKPIDAAVACIYLWNVNDQVIVVDIDGTVTKSDVRGVISTIVTERYDHVHNGVCQFFSKLVLHSAEKQSDDTIINKESQIIETILEERELEDIPKSGNIRVLYLSSRPIHLMDSTRKFISQLSQSSLNQSNTNSEIGITQCMPCFYPSIDHDDILCEIDNDFCDKNPENNKNSKQGRDNVSMFSKTKIKISTSPQNLNAYEASIENRSRLPQGPIFLYPGTLSNVLVTELVTKSTHEYKSDTLMRQIVLPFAAAGKNMNSSQLFLAGFGNKDTDAKAYGLAGIRQQDIFIINKKSELVCKDKNTSNELREEIGNDSEARYKGYDDPNLTIAILKRIEHAKSLKLSR